MNPFMLPPKQRLEEWKVFRDSLSSHDVMTRLQLAAEYWSKAPLSNYAYGEGDLASLPTPWEMIDEGDWCRDSIAMGMEFTLRMSGLEGLTLALIHDEETSQRILVLLYEDYALNYEFGEVSKLGKEAIVLSKWSWCGSKYKEHFGESRLIV